MSLGLARPWAADTIVASWQQLEAPGVARRRLTLSSEEQEARIEAQADLAELERWHDQAVTAASADEALS